ncbi:hypothetical protein LMG3441_05538 [Achromobacter kerstersii]|uniref:EamA domain-containing protein n=1 Tax=Achromobacter kerstersii TaxID=1353890 RepID=A0A6S7ANA2_9BURK|nr:hypothetical protein LMG3441_05538 [Achromobacter kerstersii]
MTRSSLYPSAQTAPATPPSVWEGYGYGFLGVLVFSLTLPMTRLAVAELAPLLVGLGRALVAAVPAVALLWITRSRLPTRTEWPGVILAALGIVVGWPLASSLAMQTVPSANGAVFNGLLPLSTAAFAALRSGERPSAVFWGWAVAGAALVTAYALRQGDGVLTTGYLWLLVAVVLGGWAMRKAHAPHAHWAVRAPFAGRWRSVPRSLWRPSAGWPRTPTGPAPQSFQPAPTWRSAPCFWAFLPGIAAWPWAESPGWGRCSCCSLS